MCNIRTWTQTRALDEKPYDLPKPMDALLHFMCISMQWRLPRSNKTIETTKNCVQVRGCCVGTGKESISTTLHTTNTQKFQTNQLWEAKQPLQDDGLDPERSRPRIPKAFHQRCPMLGAASNFQTGTLGQRGLREPSVRGWSTPICCLKQLWQLCWISCYCVCRSCPSTVY